MDVQKTSNAERICGMNDRMLDVVDMHHSFSMGDPGNLSRQIQHVETFNGTNSCSGKTTVEW
jgi:hypothetical protein